MLVPASKVPSHPSFSEREADSAPLATSSKRSSVSMRPISTAPGFGSVTSHSTLHSPDPLSPTAPQLLIHLIFISFQASSTRSPQERNTRLENMCWRIWNLARQKKQLESDHAQRINNRRLERERGRREATADMSEDLSEGEKDVSAHGDSVRGRLPRISSADAMETWANTQKGKKLYIVLIRFPLLHFSFTNSIIHTLLHDPIVIIHAVFMVSYEVRIWS